MGVFQGKWPLEAGDEVTAKNFEDIRKLVLMVTWPTFGKKYTLPAFTSYNYHDKMDMQDINLKTTDNLRIRFQFYDSDDILRVDDIFETKDALVEWATLADNPPITNENTLEVDSNYWSRKGWPRDCYYSSDDWDTVMYDEGYDSRGEEYWKIWEAAVVIQYFDMTRKKHGYFALKEYPPYKASQTTYGYDYQDMQTYGPPLDSNGNLNTTYWRLAFDWHVYEDYGDLAGHDDWPNETFHKRKEVIGHQNDDSGGYLPYVYVGDLHLWLPRQFGKPDQEKRKRIWDADANEYTFTDYPKPLEIARSHITGSLGGLWQRHPTTSRYGFQNYNQITEWTMMAPKGEPISDECEEGVAGDQYAENASITKQYQQRVVHCIEKAGTSHEDHASLLWVYGEGVGANQVDQALEDAYMFEVANDPDWKYAFERHNIGSEYVIIDGGYGDTDATDVLVQTSETIHYAWGPGTHWESPTWDSAQSIYWQCNSSAFEKVLKELARKEQAGETVRCFNHPKQSVVLTGGHFDWYWDTTMPYNPRTHPFIQEWFGLYRSNSEYPKERTKPAAEGCWRRIFKHSYEGIPEDAILFPGQDSEGNLKEPPDYHPRYRCVSPDTYDDIPEYDPDGGATSAPWLTDQPNECHQNYKAVGSGSTCEPDLSYSGGDSYIKGDFRIYNGYMYEAKQATTGNAPTGDKTDNAYWHYYPDLHFRHYPRQEKDNTEQFEIHHDLMNDMFYGLLEMSLIPAQWSFNIEYYRLFKRHKFNYSTTQVDAWTNDTPYFKETVFDNPDNYVVKHGQAEYFGGTSYPDRIYRSKQGTALDPSDNLEPPDGEVSDANWEFLGLNRGYDDSGTIPEWAATYAQREKADNYCDIYHYQVTNEETAESVKASIDASIPESSFPGEQVNTDEYHDYGYTGEMDFTTEGFETFSITDTYDIDEIVYRQGGEYKSLQKDNTGHYPSTGGDTAWWEFIKWVYTTSPRLLSTYEVPEVTLFAVRLVRRTDDGSGGYVPSKDGFVGRMGFKGISGGHNHPAAFRAIGQFDTCEFGLDIPGGSSHRIKGKYSGQNNTEMTNGYRHLKSATVETAGSGYSKYDILTVLEGASDYGAEVEVTSVDGSGGVTGVQLIDVGDSLYTYTAGIKDTAPGAGVTGTGCQVDVELLSEEPDWDTVEMDLCQFDIPSVANPIITATSHLLSPWPLDYMKKLGGIDTDFTYGNRLAWTRQTQVAFLEQEVMRIDWDGYPLEAFSTFNRNFETDVYKP